MENPNYYSILTADIRYDEKISAYEKILFSEVTALSNKAGYCTASNRYFSKLYKKDIKTISRWINHLRDKSYFKIDMIVEEGKLKERRIYPIHKNVDGYPQKSGGGINKNAEVNNTSNNNKKEKEEESKKLYEFYENNITLLTPTVAEDINAYIEDGLDSELIIACMKEAVDRNKRNWKYIKTILNDCCNNNIATKDSYLRKQEEFKEEKGKTLQNKKQEISYNTDFSEYDELAKKYEKRTK